jgi:hypothetical protein
MQRRMPNRIITFRYHAHNCLVHLFFNDEKMDVNLLDDEMANDLKVRKFTVTKTGSLVFEGDGQAAIDKKAVWEVYMQLLAYQ